MNQHYEKATSCFTVCSISFFWAGHHTEVSIDRESAREELKNIGEELKITVTNDYDPDRSLTIDKGKFWRLDKKATVLFEDSMFNEGFFIN